VGRGIGAFQPSGAVFILPGPGRRAAGEGSWRGRSSRACGLRGKNGGRHGRYPREDLDLDISEPSLIIS
jgi:hypothetical protein